VTYTLCRLDAALREAEQLRDEDFAYGDVEEFVALVLNIFEKHRKIIIGAKTLREEIQVEYCLGALSDIRVYLPFLGVSIRSATTRNAFEIYGPLKAVARKLLQPPVRLILSSGWDYTPLTFRPVDRFEEYVIIVLPATESSNPLLIPLAGHELGHSLWQRTGMRGRIEDLAVNALVQHARQREDLVSHELQLQTMSLDQARSRLERSTPFREATEWLIRQLEEMFCDFIGFYLFGESYIHAFCYFLSPDFPGRGSPKYPSVKVRCDQLHQAAKRFDAEWPGGNYVMPTNIRPLFHESTKPTRHLSGKPLTLAKSPWREAVNSVAISIVPELLDRIVLLGRRESWVELRSFSVEKRKEIVDKAFRWAVPAADAKHLANILNAAWDVELNPRFWNKLPSLASLDTPKTVQRRREILRDVVLKNIEVMEYEAKMVHLSKVKR
jgi:hypothetical protein